MGRKKIEIKLIENNKSRLATYRARAKNLIKKASELTTLCGINVSILMSDVNDNLHYYSNTNSSKFKIDPRFVNNSRKYSVHCYNQSHYPFKDFGSNSTIFKMEKAHRKEANTFIGKRKWDELDSIDHFNLLEKSKVEYAQKIAKMLKIQDMEEKEEDSKIWEEKEKRKEFIQQYLIHHGNNDTNMNPSNSQKEIEKHANFYDFCDYLGFKEGKFHEDFAKKFTVDENKSVDKFFRMIDSHLCSKDIRVHMPLITLKYIIHCYFRSTENFFLTNILRRISKESMFDVINLETGYLISSEVPPDIQFMNGESSICSTTNEKSSNIFSQKSEFSFNYFQGSEKPFMESMKSDSIQLEHDKNKCPKEDFRKKLSLILNAFITFIVNFEPQNAQENVKLNLDFSKVKIPSKFYAFIQELENNITILFAKVFTKVSKNDEGLDHVMKIIRNKYEIDHSDMKYMFEFIDNVNKMDHSIVMKIFNLLVILGLKKLAIFNHGFRYSESEFRRVFERK